uniref:Secreted protein n=1 Tax=Steinernema glaseri TaxID=37863 RepID=A0A1I8AU83_9BILA
MDIYHSAFGWFWATLLTSEVISDIIHVFYSAPVTKYYVNILLSEHTEASSSDNLYMFPCGLESRSSWLGTSSLSEVVLFTSSFRNKAVRANLDLATTTL